MASGVHPRRPVAGGHTVGRFIRIQIGDGRHSQMAGRHKMRRQPWRLGLTAGMVSVILGVVALTGCAGKASGTSAVAGYDRSSTACEQSAKEIVAVINEKNAAALMALFSEEALAKIPNFRTQAATLFAYFPNGIRNIESTRCWYAHEPSTMGYDADGNMEMGHDLHIFCGECVRKCPEDGALYMTLAGVRLYNASRMAFLREQAGMRKGKRENHG